MLTSNSSKRETSTLKVHNPYNGELIGEVPLLSWTDLNGYLDELSQFKLSLSSYERYKILFDTAQEILNRKNEIAALISREAGIALKTSLHEIDRAYNVLTFSAEEAKRITGEVLPADVFPHSQRKYAMTLREPVGTVLCITPFNHPLNQVVHKVGPAVAAGNKILLKPSEKTPLTAILFTEILIKNGFPKQAIKVFTGDIAQVSEKLLPDPRIDMIFFTGSVPVGEYIHAKAGVKKICLELGGNDPLIVFSDANLEKAAEAAVLGAFGNAGQRCTSVKRILLHEKIASSFLNLFVEKTKILKTGDPLDSSTDIGCLIDESAALKIDALVKKAVGDGAKLLTGGKRVGALYEPTILDQVPLSSDIIVHETFGPTAPVIRFQTEEEATHIANNTPYGLQAGIFTQDIDQALSVAQKLKVGGVVINEAPGYRVESLPFGGVKKSGIGREGIRYAIQEMTLSKCILL